METRKVYAKPFLVIEEFVANQYIGACKTVFIEKPGIPIHRFPSSTKMYVDGVVDKTDLGPNSTKIDGYLDSDEKNQFVTTNSSNSSSAYNGVRTAWLKDGLVEIEVGCMQNSNQWTAYEKGTLVESRNRS